MADDLRIGTSGATPLTNADLQPAVSDRTTQSAPAAASTLGAQSSEDDLVESTMLEEDTDGTKGKTGTKSNMTEADFYREQYNFETDKYFRYLDELNRLLEKQRRLEEKVEKYKDNPDRMAEYQEQLTGVNSQIATARQNIRTAENNMANLTIQIIQALEKENETNTVAATQNASVQAADSGNYTYTGESIPAELASRLDAKLGSGFSAKCESVAARVGCNANDLLAMMYSESGINPNINSAAVGLVQFMPSVLEANGYNVNQVRNMSAVQQLDVVADFLMKSKAMAGYSQNDKIDAGTLYAMNFLPATAGKEVLCSATGNLSWAYRANSPLDLDHDGSITKSDLAKRLQNKYAEMMRYF